jgi:predicted aspartyl protease
MLGIRLVIPAFVAAAALLTSACTSATPKDDAIAYTGTPGAMPAIFEQNVLRVMASINGSKERALVVDTGAAITAVDPAAFADASFTSGQATTLAASGITFKNVPAVSVSICGNACTDTTIDGLFGANILRQFVVSFDYQAPSVTLGASPLPSYVDPNGDVVPFALEGGGRGTIQGSSTVLDVPATRIALDVTVDGVVRHFVVDTGASYILLRPSIFTSIIADGRKTLTVSDQTVSGTAQGQIARTRTVSVGGALIEGVPLQTVPEAFIDGLQSEVGHPLDGLLGGSFLREFLVEIDYPARNITFRRYTDEDSRGDEFRRVGITLASSGGAYSVSKALSGTDAAKNAPSGFIGARVISIDAIPLAGNDDEQVDRMLRGNVGDTRAIVYAVGGTTKTITLAVDDVLALP